MVLMKSIGVSCITAVITEIVKILMLHFTSNPQLTIQVSSIFSYIISYIAQRLVFNRDDSFFGINCIKFFGVAVIAIQLYSLLLDWIQNLNFIKNTIEDPKLSNTRKKIYQYIVINISILTVFLLFEFPLRKYFIFTKTPYDYNISLLLYFIALLMCSYV